jgi:hypothetical protein
MRNPHVVHVTPLGKRTSWWGERAKVLYRYVACVRAPPLTHSRVLLLLLTYCWLYYRDIGWQDILSVSLPPTRATGDDLNGHSWLFHEIEK